MNISFVVRADIPKECYPRRETAEAAGIDLFAVGEVEIPPHGRVLVNTGVEVILPPNTYGRIADTSTLAFITGLHVISGVIDSDYEGEIGVLLTNPTNHTVVLRAANKIAQLVVTPYIGGRPTILSNTLRSQIDFQSTRKGRGFGYLNTETAFKNPNPASSHSSYETWSGNRGPRTGKSQPSVQSQATNVQPSVSNQSL
jgi:dUTP pyrophosphatase